MRFCSLASGSDGNCHYVEGRDAALLIDAGLSGKQIETNMASRGLSPENPEAILITHEHSDHIAGVAVWARRYGTPVYATAATWAGMGPLRERIPGELCHVITAGVPFTVGSLWITPLPVCHDAGDPVAYLIREDDTSIAVVTDTGTMTEEVFAALLGTKLAVIESNYDLYMLRHGPYPRELQRRIEGCLGHLSNDDCGEVLAGLYAANPDRICLLGHLSQNNNTPARAMETVSAILRDRLGYVPESVGLTHRGKATEIMVINNE